MKFYASDNKYAEREHVGAKEKEKNPKRKPYIS